MTDIWQHAKDNIDRKDLEMAWSLGFEYCQGCGEWFHMGKEGWEDCVLCGRYCPTCASSLDWEWCEECGLIYCNSCYGDAETFTCEVCMIEF
jgi:hypothetical protein